MDMAIARAVADTVKNAKWTLGDLALEVIVEYGEDSLGKFANEIGFTPTTLKDYRTVSAAYKKDQRSPTTSWSVHKIFQSQWDRVDLVNNPNPETGRPWLVGEARDLVTARSFGYRRRRP